MRKVVDRLDARIAEGDDQITVVYLNPKHKELFERSGQWQTSFHNDTYLVLRAQSSRQQ
jgi:hypothetical protein